MEKEQAFVLLVLALILIIFSTCVGGSKSRLRANIVLISGMKTGETSLLHGDVSIILRTNGRMIFRARTCIAP